MRWILAVLFLAWGADARAEARLRVTSDRPIVIVVNAIPYTCGDGTVHTIDIKDGREGRQNVRVLNLLGQEVWQGHVEVPKNREIKARWQGRTFEVYSDRQLPSQAPRSNRPSGSRTGAANLDDIAAKTGGPDNDAVTDVEALIRHAPDASSAASPAPEAEGPAPPPPGVPSQLRLVNRNTSWANVYVNGEKLEFRGGTEPVVLDLDSGSHRVEVKDFQDKEDWGHGTVWVYPDVVVELHFSKHEAPAALNLPEAWRPDPE